MKPLLRRCALVLLAAAVSNVASPQRGGGTPQNPTAPEDIKHYFRALKRAQRDIDLRPELYTHYYRNEFPDRFHAMMDTRRWGPGERIVFEPYSREVYEQSFEWIEKHGIFEAGKMGDGSYDKATIRLGAV